MKDKIIDSPFLWSGKKTKLLPQIKPLFKESKIFVDLFGGSGSVVVNSDSEIISYNDLFMGQLLKTIYETPTKDILTHVDNRIKEFNLTKTDKESYYVFKSTITEREMKDNEYYLDLFTISLFAFNGALEFNMKKGLTSSFGKRNRRKVVEPILIEFKNKLDTYKKASFKDLDYIDYSEKIISAIINKKILPSDIFVYVDCPYTITRINGYKSDYNDLELFKILKRFDDIGINWALSNVLEHKGKKNDGLILFAKEFNVNYLDFNYNNLNNTMEQESKKTKNNETIEVLITNY